LRSARRRTSAIWRAHADFRAVMILGVEGYGTKYPVERLHRDVKLCEIGEGTSEIQRLVISRNILREVK
jgi:alkylation response protein AidB-like acyl-CoA dehydrogenase